MDFWSWSSQLLLRTNEHEQQNRIKAVVVLIALLLLVAYVFNMRRWRSRNRILHWTLIIFDAISDSMVTYSIGLMQQATSPDISDGATFSIWAVLLLILSASYNNDFDRSKVGRLKLQLANLMNYLLTANLNLSTKYDRASLVVWFLWLLHLCKFVLRAWIFELADASYRHGKNSLLVAAYMRSEYELSQPQESYDPATMSGYKYLVHGEGESKLEPEEPDYLIKLKVGNDKKLITLEKVWQCEGRLLDSNGDPDCKLKDLCLSFALYKLIRRRFDDLHPPPAADHPKAHALFREGLLSQGQDYRRVFRVIGIELTFLSDYFHSLLPAMLFTRYRVFYTLILVSFGMAFFLLVIVAREIQRYTLEFFITIVLVCMVILKGVLEVLSLVFSNWTKLLFLCAYVEHTWWHDNTLVEMPLRFLCGLKILKHWHNKISQYHLLKSFRHDSILRHSTKSTMWKFKTKVKEGPRVKIPEEAKKAIFDSLKEQIRSGQLSNGTESLRRNRVDRLLSWALKTTTNVHTILVWHVATCLCELNMELNMSLRHRVVGRSVRNCFRPTNFILDGKSLNGARLQANYVVASSLSQYCAYLLVFCPELLRYHGLTINFILKRTAKEAWEILNAGRACSMKDLHDKLWDAVGVVDKREEETHDNVMRTGARLGRTLLEEIGDDERIWKVLAEFWAEMVVFIAPCPNKGAHKEHLDSGGEFLTHLWALLHHAGIDEVNDEAPMEEEQQQQTPAVASQFDMC